MQSLIAHKFDTQARSTNKVIKMFCNYFISFLKSLKPKDNKELLTPKQYSPVCNVLPDSLMEN